MIKDTIEVIRELIEITFFSLIIKQRKWLINRSEKKIAKYKSKLSIEEKVYVSLIEDTRELLRKGTYMDEK